LTEVPIPYMFGLFFRFMYTGISPQFIWPKIWYSNVQYLHLLDPGDLPLIQVCYPLVIEHNNTTIWRIIIFNRTRWAIYTTAKSFPRATYVWFSNTLVTARRCPI
jgi:hypothetical protein